MQVFKTFLKVTQKRLHISMIYIGVFISICVAMTFISSETSNFENSKLDISIVDMDNTEASKAFTEFIAQNHNIVNIENDKDVIIDSLYYMRADIVLTINEGYSRKLANGETNSLFSDYRVPGTYSAEFFDSQINKYISTINACMIGGMSIQEAYTRAAELSENEVNVETLSFSDNANVEYNSDISGFFQYLAYILIVVLISGLCPTLLVITGKEIRNRTNCSCISVSKQMTQIIAGTVIFSAAVYLLLIIVAAILYKSMLFNEKGLLAILNGFVYLIFTMMLTLFIAVISPSPKVVDMIANILSLGMSFLCGVFVPQMLLSDTVVNAGKFFPAYWYIKANNMLAGTNNEVFGADKFMICIGIELAFSIALLCATLLVAKTKRSSKSV